MKTKSTLIHLSEFAFREVEMLDSYAETAAELIKTTEQLKAVRDEAMPAEALSEPTVMEQVKHVDLVWAFDATDKDKTSLIGGAELLGYSMSRLGKKLSFTSMGFYYDPECESLDNLRRTVLALKFAYRLENHIIKTFADDYPLLGLFVNEISDPNVRKKVAEADVISVMNDQNKGEVVTFDTKAARECAKQKDNSFLTLKLMAFSFDPKVDSLEDFTAALEEIKGKNWQN